MGTKLTNEIEVLKAIDNVRLELASAVKLGDYDAKNEALQRLLGLYAALDVHNVIVAIERIEYRKAA
jgi:hypothetical protein